jgi:putative peptidoglycan lipid II flippase
VLNAILDFAFYRFGTWGIPLATAVCNVVSTIALVVLLRDRLGRIGGRAIAGALAKIVVASALLAPASYLVWRPLDSALGRSFPAQVVSLGAALAAAGVTYLLACRALKVREMQALLSLRTRLQRG